MRIDNPSVSGSITFVNGTNTINSSSVSLTGSLSGTFDGVLVGNSATAISGALGENADLIRSLTADGISGSLGTNASLIRSLTATGISGSLGSNATLIRSLTAASISGSVTNLSSSISTDFGAKLNVSDTGSFAKKDQANTFEQPQTFTDINVNGTGSFAYIQSITGSAKIIGDAFIVVNSEGTGSRFAGIQVIDSGSATTSSLQWDSLVNKWQYFNSGDVGYGGGGLISGPRITGSQNADDIYYPTLNTLVRGQGGDHIYDSNIIDNDTAVKIGINTEVTGSLTVSSGITGTLTGNASTATSASHADAAPYSGLYGTVPTWNQDTTGNAATATTATTATSAGNADTVDSLHASQFLRSDADDAFTGNLTTGADNHITFGPNTTWGSYLRVGGNGHTATGTEMASVVTTDGNLHLDAADSTNGIYLNYYAGTEGTWFGDGGGNVVARLRSNGQLYKGTGTGVPYWHADNDGAGSGLDADTVDGIQASSFLQKNTTYTPSDGVVSFQSNGAMESTSGDQASIEIYQSTAGEDAIMQFHISGDYAAYFGLDGSDNQFKVGGWSMGANKYKIWHEGNDGPDSGLNADLLDGIGGDGYLRSNADDTYTGTLTVNGTIDFGNDAGYQLIMPTTHDKQKIGLYGPEGTGAEWIGTSSGTLELSGGSINLNGANGTGTPTLKMGGTTIVDSSRNASFAGGTFSGTISVGSSFVAGTNVSAGYYQDTTNGAYRAITTSGTVGYYFQSNNGGSTTMYIGLAGTYAGRVGIGSSATTPDFVLQVGGDIGPDGNGTRNLGSSTRRWNTIYTSDLSMSNGIGDYTIVEGEEDLFLYNNKTGKTFKFMLQEVDPSIVPPKRK